MHKLRAPGMGWFRMPLFLWGLYATALIQVLATPVLAITLLLIAVERLLGLGIFDPKLGGDPVLFQHFFWFYSHPAVYIMILPGMGIISEIISVFSDKHIFGYRFIAYSSVAIALVGFLVWGHHMFVSGAVAGGRRRSSRPDVRRGHPLGDQGVQLAGDHVQGLDLAGHADVLRPGLPVPLRHRRPDRDSSSAPSRSTSPCTAPTSSWPISITSWWAARWSASWPGCTTGGRR